MRLSWVILKFSCWPAPFLKKWLQPKVVNIRIIECMKWSMVWLTFCCLPGITHIRRSSGQLIRFIAGWSITSMWAILQRWVWLQAELIDERIQFWTQTWSQGCFGRKNDKISWHLPIVSSVIWTVCSRCFTFRQHQKNIFTAFSGHKSGQVLPVMSNFSWNLSRPF